MAGSGRKATVTRLAVDWQRSLSNKWTRQMASNEFLRSAKPELARYVSKTGDFALVENVIDQCKARLDTSEIVSLYEYIRDESGRLEEEWRDEFIEAFDNIEPFLPDVEAP